MASSARSVVRKLSSAEQSRQPPPTKSPECATRQFDALVTAQVAHSAACCRIATKSQRASDKDPRAPSHTVLRLCLVVGSSAPNERTARAWVRCCSGLYLLLLADICSRTGGGRRWSFWWLCLVWAEQLWSATRTPAYRGSPSVFQRKTACRATTDSSRRGDPAGKRARHAPDHISTNQFVHHATDAGLVGGRSWLDGSQRGWCGL